MWVSNRVALITGGASGLGFCYAIELLKNGLKNGTIYGCFLAMEEYLPKYKSGDEGIVVNISSALGLTATPFLPVYIATKHAIIGLGRSLGMKQQYDSCKVRVLTLCPGATLTPLLQDLDKKMLNQRYLGLLAAAYEEATKELPTQPTDPVTKALMKMLEEGGTGSIWVAEMNEVYELELPSRKEMKRK